jgi:DNA-directed RNA polymerase subunit RPC12/RpoP
MSQTPSIDYRCTRCGALHIYQLVPLAQRPTEAEVKAIPHEIPSIDFTCSRCGASQTYKVVPDAVRRLAGSAELR